MASEHTPTDNTQRLKNAEERIRAVALRTLEREATEEAEKRAEEAENAEKLAVVKSKEEAQRKEAIAAAAQRKKEIEEQQKNAGMKWSEEHDLRMQAYSNAITPEQRARNNAENKLARENRDKQEALDREAAQLAAANQERNWWFDDVYSKNH